MGRALHLRTWPRRASLLVIHRLLLLHTVEPNVSLKHPRHLALQHGPIVAGLRRLRRASWDLRGSPLIGGLAGGAALHVASREADHTEGSRRVRIVIRVE